MSKKVKLGIFDIDGTVFRSSLLVELINGLVDAHIFPSQARLEMEEDYLNWVNRTGDYEAYIQKVINIHVKYIAGCKRTAVEAVADQVVSWQKQRLYRYTRNLISDLKKKDYYLLCISGSPTYIVSRFAKTMGFKSYFGSEYEVKKGVFTGKVLNLDTFYKKAFVLHEFIKTNKLNADLKNSYGIGDTESDIPILEVVGHPIAINPNRRLAGHAQKNGWDIVVERKDVLYNIKKFEFLS